MSNTEAQFLDLLFAEGRLSFHDLTIDEAHALDNLVARGYIRRDVVMLDNRWLHRAVVYAITDAGRLARQDYHQRRRQYAQKIAEQQRKQRDIDRQQRAAWLSPLVASVVGAIVGTLGSLFVLYLTR